jgi:enterochelin esterase-like enzyme
VEFTVGNMKACHLLLVGLFLSSGCGSPVRRDSNQEIAGLAHGCNSAGTVEYDYFVETSDDFPYEYGLYLPPCYDAEAGRYPVVYLIPGKGGGRRDWFQAGAAAFADDLILTGELPPFLIVAAQDIGNDVDGEIISGQLMAYIESVYPLSPLSRHRAVAGASAGGISAYHIGLGQPDRVGAIGMFGMGLIPGDTEQVRTWLAGMPPGTRPRLFLNSCNSDPLGTIEMARGMLALFDQAGFSHTHIFNPGYHDFNCWAPNLPAFFHWLALDW